LPPLSLSLIAPLAAGSKELLDDIGALSREDTRGYFYLVIQFGVRKDLETGANGTTFYIVTAVHDAGNSRLNDGAGAHAARLDRDIQCRACQAIVADRAGCFTQHHDFGVRRGIAIADRAIRAARHDHSVAIAHKHGADGYFACGGCGARFFERDSHEIGSTLC
jgi:hypothetical protein